MINLTPFRDRRLAAGGPLLRAALDRPILVEETVPHYFARLISIGLSVITLALVVWAGFAPLYEVSRAQGSILPSGLERVIQHLEGGIIRQINVQPGDIVAAGGSLFVLDDASSGDDLAALDTQRANLLAELAVLRALARGETPDLSGMSEGQRAVAEANLEAYTASTDARRAREELLESQIAQAQDSIDATIQQIAGQKIQVDYAQSELERVRILVAEGIQAKVQEAQRQNALDTARNQLSVLESRLSQARNDLSETQSNLKTFRAETVSDLTSRIQRLQSNLAQFDAEFNKTQSRRDRLNVTSPVKGIVKSVQITTLGGVIQPGQQLATIVPIDEELYAEVRLAPDQVGYVHEGQDAHIKVTAYDFTRFGWIDGEVQSISPATFVGKDGRSYFNVRVKLRDNKPAYAPDALILPGMEVNADIITGDNTVLAYLLNPVRKAFGSSFGER